MQRCSVTRAEKIFQATLSLVGQRYEYRRWFIAHFDDIQCNRGPVPAVPGIGRPGTDCQCLL